MRVAAFGTLVAVEPGIATALGLVVLSQTPDALQAAGVGLVVFAGIGAASAIPIQVDVTHLDDLDRLYAAVAERQCL